MARFAPPAEVLALVAVALDFLLNIDAICMVILRERVWCGTLLIGVTLLKVADQTLSPITLLAVDGRPSTDDLSPAVMRSKHRDLMIIFRCDLIR